MVKALTKVATWRIVREINTRAPIHVDTATRKQRHQVCARGSAKSLPLWNSHRFCDRGNGCETLNCLDVKSRMVTPRGGLRTGEASVVLSKRSSAYITDGLLYLRVDRPSSGFSRGSTSWETFLSADPQTFYWVDRRTARHPQSPF